MLNLSNDMKVFVKTWLDRVSMQFEPKAQEAEKEYDREIAKSSLATNRILAAIISSNQRPSVEQHGLINNVTNVNHYHTPNSSTSGEAKKTKKEQKKVNWKDIAVITFTCTVITSISVFVYTRLAKTEQRAKNYLEKTKMIKDFAEKHDFGALSTVANVQQEIDQNAVNKILGYKRATLTTLAGVVIATSGFIAMPWFATAATVARLFGMTTIAGSAVYAAYNLAAHWDDKEEAQEKLREAKSALSELQYAIFAERQPPVNPHFHQESFAERQPPFNPHFHQESKDSPPPPTYDESQLAYGYIATESLYPVLPGKD